MFEICASIWTYFLLQSSPTGLVEVAMGFAVGTAESARFPSACFPSAREYQELCFWRLLTQSRISSGSCQGISWYAERRNGLCGSLIHSCGNSAIVSLSVTFGAGC